MSNTWFTADTHFGHANILKHEALTRPFTSIEEHDDYLVQQWNAVVRPKDNVWHLGDLIWGKQEPSLLRRLNGSIKLVLGNHDLLHARTYLDYVQNVYGVVELKDGWLLSHLPVHPSELCFGIQLNLHGHLHSKRLDNPGYFNVGVDVHGLAPVHSDVIRDYMRSLAN